MVLPSGVQYEVLKAGSGKQPRADDTVVIQYEGSLTNGVVFDSTREDDKPARLALKEIVVPGMREALMLMNEGAKWRVVIPPAMGFGRAGNNMLRKRDLIYEIELLAVESPVKEAPAAAGAVNTQGAGRRPEWNNTRQGTQKKSGSFPQAGRFISYFRNASGQTATCAAGCPGRAQRSRWAAVRIGLTLGPTCIVAMIWIGSGYDALADGDQLARFR